VKNEFLQSVHTVCSAQEAVSYCEDVASTKACAGSMADAKSIGGGDSASLRVCTGSIGPDNVSGRHFVHTDRGSPGTIKGLFGSKICIKYFWAGIL
jgi:hypothetical protein